MNAISLLLNGIKALQTKYILKNTKVQKLQKMAKLTLQD